MVAGNLSNINEEKIVRFAAEKPFLQDQQACDKSGLCQTYMNQALWLIVLIVKLVIGSKFNPAKLKFKSCRGLA